MKESDDIEDTELYLCEFYGYVTKGNIIYQVLKCLLDNKEVLAAIDFMVAAVPCNHIEEVFEHAKKYVYFDKKVEETIELTMEIMEDEDLGW